MGCHQDGRPVRHYRSRWAPHVSNMINDCGVGRRGRAVAPRKPAAFAISSRSLSVYASPPGVVASIKNANMACVGARDTILVRNEFYGAGSSLRGQARFHLSQDRCALLGAEMVEEIREDHEIELASPIHLERISRNRAESLTDASVSARWRTPARERSANPQPLRLLPETPSPARCRRTRARPRCPELLRAGPGRAAS